MNKIKHIIVYWFLILFYLLSSPGFLYSSTSCRNVIAVIDQNHQSFFKAGLFSSSSKSLLCGPSCIISSLVTLGVVPNFRLNSQVIDLVKNDFPKIGIHDVTERGMFTNELESSLDFVAKKHFKNLEKKSFSYSFNDIILSNANRADKVVIVLHSGWGKMRNLNLVSEGNKTASHFSILTGVKKISEDVYLVQFNDPVFGQITAKLEKAITPMMPNSESYKINFENSGLLHPGWGEKGYIRLLSYALVINVKS